LQPYMFTILRFFKARSNFAGNGVRTSAQSSTCTYSNLCKKPFCCPRTFIWFINRRKK
jgi:hypothetical protein